jgi:hypothetical protein
MSSKPNKKGAKQQRDAVSSNAHGSDDQALFSQDSQPTPAYGFPAVSAEDLYEDDEARSFEGASVKKDDAANYDFLWESTETKRSAKGAAGTTTVVESDTDYLLLPHPDVFNAYPPEVQRKIMEWADRDVRARRDDESLRQDALIRAQAARERMTMAVPVAIIILCIVCAAVTGLYTKSAVFAVAFLVVAVAVILALYFTRKNDLYAQSEPLDEEEEEE